MVNEVEDGVRWSNRLAEEAGFLDALDAHLEEIIAGLTVDHLPEHELQILAEFGSHDPKPDLQGIIYLLKARRKQRSQLAIKGALAAKMHTALPADDPRPVLEEGLRGLEAACRCLFGVSRKRNVDRWRLTEARGFLTLLFQAEDLKDRRKLYEAIVSLEHGGQAMILVNQFLDGQTTGRRRIPPKRDLILEGQAP